MTNRQPKIQFIAWAWAASWILASLGQAISDVYSSPNRGLIGFYVLGFAGWAIGAAVTIDYVRRQFEANGYVIALSVAGWGIGALVAVMLGLFWMETWNLGFLGLPVAAALGGTIGGALTLPVRSLSSPATLVRASVRGAFSWGATFLIFQVLALYAGYILVQMTVNPLVPIIGNIWAKVPGWALPTGLGGLHAAWLASRSLRSNKSVKSA